MTLRRSGALAAWLIGAAAAVPAAAAAQSFVAQPQYYLLTTDAFDGRALWLQPAGLSRRREASLAAMLTADGGGINQFGLTMASGGLGVGWQHDRRVGIGTDVFSIGLGIGGPLLGLGADHRWYRGPGVKDGSWDIGARAAVSPALDLSLVWRDIGTPVYLVVDTMPHTINPTLVSGAAVNLLGRLHVAAEWEIVTSSWGTSAYHIGAAAYLLGGLAVTVRGDFSPGLDARAGTVSLTWSGARSRLTGFAASLRGADGQYGAWASAVRELAQPRRGRPFR